MIGYLKGNIKDLKANSVIIEVQGVGYLVHISAQTYYVLSSKDKVELYIHTYVKEDKLELYGFTEEAEMVLFKVLISVSGLGPSLSLAILSTFEGNQLLEIVKERNIQRLMAVPGIGKSKAEKIMLELKTRLKSHIEQSKSNLKTSGVPNNYADPEDESKEALLALGYDLKSVENVLKEAKNELGDVTTEELLKKSLSYLSRC